MDGSLVYRSPVPGRIRGTETWDTGSRGECGVRPATDRSWRPQLPIASRYVRIVTTTQLRPWLPLVSRSLALVAFVVGILSWVWQPLWVVAVIALLAAVVLWGVDRTTSRSAT